MIVVLADDLSGATELAAVASARGLATEVQTEWDIDSKADVVCLDTDTRLLPAEHAVRRVTRIATEIAAAGQTWVYKKCDSVLRGHPALEAQAIGRALGYRRTLLIPANPTRGRVIRDGRIWIHEKPLHETLFAHDPDFPRLTSRVAELLPEADESILIPNVSSTEQLQGFARGLDRHTLAAGGAEFFDALLAAIGFDPQPMVTASTVSSRSTLLICGSAAAWSDRTAIAESVGIPIVSIEQHGWQQACAAAEAAWQMREQLLLGIGDVREDAVDLEDCDAGLSFSRRLLRPFADTAEQTLHRLQPRRCCIEGGATAAALMRSCGWTKCRVVEVADVGLAYLHPITPHAEGAMEPPTLIIKPGSYAWPTAIWPNAI